MPSKFFIDTHCHFFSVQHIPLTQTLQRVQKKLFGSNAKKIKFGVVATAMSPLFPFSGVIANDLIKKVIPFIRFFDTDAADSINEALKSLMKVEKVSINTRVKIFTPLVMDFEKCVSYKKMKEQVTDLRENILRIEPTLVKNKCLVLPFMGLDVRRFDKVQSADVGDTLDKIIKKNVGTIERYTADNVETDARNGNFIGIKLYPSLGGDLWPAGNDANSKARQNRNIAIMKELATRKYPITVHCQTDSYECGKLSISDKQLINNANPQKWLKLLGAMDKDDAKILRLNLAHFGGEAGVTKMCHWDEDENQDVDRRFWRINKGASWTYWIIKLIKNYKNAYSDIGAFDFEDDQAAASLLWLIHKDNNGELGIPGRYKLIDKLLWGTDIPMTMFDNKDYKEQFDKFYRNTNLKHMHRDVGFMFEVPDPANANIPPHGELIDILVNKNPAKFLFGG